MATVDLGPRERRYVGRVMATRRLSYGPFSRRFESGFARAHGRAHGVFCNSGTSALHVSLAALKERHGWRDGDEVLVPSVTFVSTVNVVLHNRLTPVFVDVDARTYNMDPALLEAKTTRRSRCVIPVHVAGLPCDMAPIMELARRRRLRVLEDSCETVFARYRGKPVGSFGDAGCFSTHAAHSIVTGVGGLALTDDAGLALRLRSLINHGRDTAYLRIDDDDGLSPAGRRRVAARRFRFPSIGYSFRLTELEAAIGVAQLERKDAITRARKENARFLIEALRDISDLQLPFVPDDRDHVFMVFPLALRRGDKRPLIGFLEARGIETRDLLPLIDQPAHRALFGRGVEKRYPVARWLERGGLYVGCHQGLSRRDLAYMAETIRSFFRGRR